MQLYFYDHTCCLFVEMRQALIYLCTFLYLETIQGVYLLKSYSSILRVEIMICALLKNTNLQQFAALFQATLLRHGTAFHLADKDPHPVPSDHGDVVGKAGPLLRRRSGRSWRRRLWPEVKKRAKVSFSSRSWQRQTLALKGLNRPSTSNLGVVILLLLSISCTRGLCTCTWR